MSDANVGLLSSVFPGNVLGVDGAEAIVRAENLRSEAVGLRQEAMALICGIIF